ncbi:MAG: hypothetical protein H0X42_12340 [Solirubrobacterales bacterium]|nr:hypothetical protein [Solirubrobacterales bacterium]
MEGAIEQADAFADQDVGGVLGLGRGGEPALRVLLAVEGGEGPDRSSAGER